MCFVFICYLLRFEKFLLLTPNDHKYPPIWGRMTLGDLGNHFFVIRTPRASFWYIICLGLKIFGFWPQMTPKTPQFGVGWPQVTSECTFVIRAPRASFWYIICPGLKIFGFWPQMTPNTPKPPQTLIFFSQKLYQVIRFNLSYLELWLVDHVTSYQWNKPKPEVGHKTGSYFKLRYLLWHGVHWKMFYRMSIVAKLYVSTGIKNHWFRDLKASF